MKIKREAIIGLISLITIAGMIWGYKFVKGEVLLSQSYSFQSTFADVFQLAPSNPVLVNGLKVGSITDIKVNPNNTKEMIVSYLVNGEFNLPKNTKAVMISDGLVGGKALSLEYDDICSGSNCAQDGDTFEGVSRGMIATMLKGEDIGEYAEKITKGVTKGLSGENGEAMSGPLGETMASLQETLTNAAKLTATMNNMMARSSSNLQKTMSNVESITANLAENNAQISSMLSNFNRISTDISNAKLGSTLNEMGETVKGANTMMVDLQKTAKEADASVKKLNEIMTKMNEGNGTMAKLLNDQALYQNMEKTSKNLSLLLQDLRLNPSRYVKVSVFGGKNNDAYVKPENDPAFNNEKKKN